MGKKHSKESKKRIGGSFNEHATYEVKECEPISCIGVTDELVLTGSNVDGILHGYNKHTNKETNKWLLHEREITKIEIDLATNAVYTASRDKCVNRMSLHDENIQQKYNGHTLVVTALSLKEDGRQFVSGSRDCSVKLWNVEKSSVVKSETVPRNLVTDMKWSISRDTIVQCSEDKLMKLWDSRNLKHTSTFPMKQYFQTCCDVKEDFILTGSTGANSNGCEVTLYDMRQLNTIHNLKGHTEKVVGCKFVAQNRFVTIGHDCAVKLWDANTGKCLASEMIGGAKQLTSISLDRDRLFVGTFQRGIHSYKIENDDLIFEKNF